MAYEHNAVHYPNPSWGSKLDSCHLLVHATCKILSGKLFSCPSNAETFESFNSKGAARKTSCRPFSTMLHKPTITIASYRGCLLFNKCIKHTPQCRVERYPRSCNNRLGEIGAPHAEVLRHKPPVCSRWRSTRKHCLVKPLWQNRNTRTEGREVFEQFKLDCNVVQRLIHAIGHPQSTRFAKTFHLHGLRANEQERAHALCSRIPNTFVYINKRLWRADEHACILPAKLMQNLGPILLACKPFADVQRQGERLREFLCGIRKGPICNSGNQIGIRAPKPHGQKLTHRRTHVPPFADIVAVRATASHNPHMLIRRHRFSPFRKRISQSSANAPPHGPAAKPKAPSQKTHEEAPIDSIRCKTVQSKAKPSPISPSQKPLPHKMSQARSHREQGCLAETRKSHS